LKILITGTNGYVGKNLSKYFSKTNDVYGIVRKKNTNEYLKKCYVGDLSDKIFVNSLDNQFDVLINCAANTDHFAPYQKSYKDNVITVKNLLNAKNLKYKKFIHISTEAVFLTNKAIKLNEKSQYNNSNLSTYSKSKKLAEIEILKFKCKKKKLIIVRPRLIWGGSNSPVYKKLKWSIEKKLFFWVDNGNYLTSSTNIFNLAKGLDKTIKHGKHKKVYFILDKNPIKFKKLIYKIIGSKYKNKNFLSFPRKLVYIMCLFSDIIYYVSFKCIRIPLSRSLYFMTFSTFVIDNSFSVKKLNLKPKMF
jgi:nucleoside-diphosphate-sugar epimerase